MKKEVFNVKQIADYTGLGTTTVYSLVREGKIPHRRVRSRILFFKEAIDEWLKGD